MLGGRRGGGRGRAGWGWGGWCRRTRQLTSSITFHLLWIGLVLIEFWRRKKFSPLLLFITVGYMINRVVVGPIGQFLGGTQ